MAISGTKVRSVSVLMAYLHLVFVFSRFLVLFSSILVVSLCSCFDCRKCEQCTGVLSVESQHEFTWCVDQVVVVEKVCG